MALFQTTVLNKFLAEQDKDFLIAQYNIFKSYFLGIPIYNTHKLVSIYFCIKATKSSNKYLAS